MENPDKILNCLLFLHSSLQRTIAHERQSVFSLLFSLVRRNCQQTHGILCIVSQIDNENIGVRISFLISGQKRSHKAGNYFMQFKLLCNSSLCNTLICSFQLSSCARNPRREKKNKGKKKHNNDENIESDECSKATCKMKIVRHSCVGQLYNM